MQTFIDAIWNSYDNKNWHAALFLALSMPDICAGMENPGQGNGVRYRAWCDRYLLSAYVTTRAGESPTTWLTADDCWALRNSVLHEGTDTIRGSKATLSQIKFTTGPIHRARIDKVAVLNFGCFCADIADGVESWLADVANKPDVMARIANMARVETEEFQVGPMLIGGF